MQKKDFSIEAALSAGWNVYRILLPQSDLIPATAQEAQTGITKAETPEKTKASKK